MAVYAIGDLHLSLGCEKPMDIFKGWENYTEKLTEKWNTVVSDSDTVVIIGDISWGMTLDEALMDFRYINDRLKGHKIFLKGNHDYWWSTMAKIERFKQEHSLDRIEFLFNNSFVADGLVICGTRGWTLEESNSEELKIILREAGRLERSIKSAKTAPDTVFLHYPPITNSTKSQLIIDVMQKYNIERCYYGHLHGDAVPYAVNRSVDGISYRLLSADSIGFCPYKIKGDL